MSRFFFPGLNCSGSTLFACESSILGMFAECHKPYETSNFCFFPHRVEKIQLELCQK